MCTLKSTVAPSRDALDGLGLDTGLTTFAGSSDFLSNPEANFTQQQLESKRKDKGGEETNLGSLDKVDCHETWEMNPILK